MISTAGAPGVAAGAVAGVGEDGADAEGGAVDQPVQRGGSDAIALGEENAGEEQDESST